MTLERRIEELVITRRLAGKFNVGSAVVAHALLDENNEEVVVPDGFFTNAVARVDPAGDDATGVVGDVLKPFLTVQGAIDAIEAGSFVGPVIELGQSASAVNVTTSLTELTFRGVASDANSSHQLGTITLTSLDRVHIYLDSCVATGVSALSDDIDVYLLGNAYITGNIHGTGAIGVAGNPGAIFSGTVTGTGNDWISIFDLCNANQGGMTIVAGTGNVVIRNSVVDTITSANQLYVSNSSITGTNNATTRFVDRPEWVTLSPDLVWIGSAGAPTTLGTKFAGKGSICSDYTNGNLYINAGTKATPSWKLVTRAA